MTTEKAGGHTTKLLYGLTKLMTEGQSFHMPRFLSKTENMILFLLIFLSKVSLADVVQIESIEIQEEAKFNGFTEADQALHNRIIDSATTIFYPNQEILGIDSAMVLLETYLLSHPDVEAVWVNSSSISWILTNGLGNILVCRSRRR